MKIYIANKKSKIENIRKKYPTASVLDVTSTSEYEILRFLSPFYPHGNIPIPGMQGRTATCVEAIWQGLKVFEYDDVDYASFSNDTMRNIKRSVRKYGKPLGHRYGTELLSYADARWKIYLPTYLYVLENVSVVQCTIQKIRERLMKTDVVFLDYNTNCDVADYSKPLSHACLVKYYLESNYPTIEKRKEWESQSISCANNRLYEGGLESLLYEIRNHPKYNETKFEVFMYEIRNMKSFDLGSIAALGGKGRTTWRMIIRDIKKSKQGNQLSLFGNGDGSL